MFHGYGLPLKENLDIAVEILERCHKNELIFEVEAGVVGGVDEGIKGGGGEKPYSAPAEEKRACR